MEMQSRLVVVHAPLQQTSEFLQDLPCLEELSSPDVPKPPKKRFLEEAAARSGSGRDENEEPLDLSGEFFIRTSQQDLINLLVEKLCRNLDDKADDHPDRAVDGADLDLPLKKRSITKGNWTHKERPSLKYLGFVNKGIAIKKPKHSLRN